MSEAEVRLDQLTGLRTILAPARAARAGALHAEPAVATEEGRRECPFCPGREDRTPPAVLNIQEGNQWSQRAFPSLHPAVGAPGEIDPERPARDSGVSSAADPLLASARRTEQSLFTTKPAGGSHEVIVNAAEHAASLGALGADGIAAAMSAWRERAAAHADSAAYVHLIVNEGRLAGATVEHTHAQLFALDFVPAEVARERERAAAYHQRTQGSHLLEDIGVEEIRRGDRLVAVDGEAILICPWASRHPYAMRLVPRERRARFADSEGGAAMLSTALDALAATFDGLPQLNLWVRSAPRGADEFHWYIDIAPRLTAKAGFELGTGVDINPVAPELAAAELRESLGA